MTVINQVNELQSKIKDHTRKMMAMVSELSMHQANALKLQQEVKARTIQPIHPTFAFIQTLELMSFILLKRKEQVK